MNHRQNDWEDALSLCEFAYNDMTHGSSQNSPFFLIYGQNPRSAEDLHLGVPEFPTNPAARNWLEEKQHSLSIAKDRLQEAMVRQASYADRQRHERKFSENQQVLVHRDHTGAVVLTVKRVQNYATAGLVLSKSCKCYLPQLLSLSFLLRFELILCLMFLF